jgi:hypothetical protein
MLFDLTFPCYLTTFSGKKFLSGKVICAFFCPAYRSSPVPKMLPLLDFIPTRTFRRTGLVLACRERGTDSVHTIDSPHFGHPQIDGFASIRRMADLRTVNCNADSASGKKTAVMRIFQNPKFARTSPSL